MTEHTSADISSGKWPEWFKNIIAVATLGVPVVLWLFSVSATAGEAKAIAVKVQSEVRELEERLIRSEERYANILKTQGEIKERLKVSPSEVLAAVRDLAEEIDRLKGDK